MRGLLVVVLTVVTRFVNGHFRLGSDLSAVMSIEVNRSVVATIDGSVFAIGAMGIISIAQSISIVASGGVATVGMIFWVVAEDAAVMIRCGMMVGLNGEVSTSTAVMIGCSMLGNRNGVVLTSVVRLPLHMDWVVHADCTFVRFSDFSISVLLPVEVARAIASEVVILG